MKNLLAGLPDSLPEELVDILVQNQQLRIERIVSTGHSSPDDFWLDQEQHEWVVVLQGQATLVFEDEGWPEHFQPGDHVLIRKHRKHRVAWTTPHEPTVWLAVFFD